MRATLHGVVLAESDETIVVEGNHYFPVESARTDLFEPSDLTAVCPWKGTAAYYNVVIGEHRHADAAWYYPEPKNEAHHIKGHIAFAEPTTVTN
jgi:uncharacterized protein (DUF427 family)